MTDFVRSHRRDFLLDTTRGLGGVALGAMLADDGITRAAPTTSVPDGLAHIAPVSYTHLTLPTILLV